MHPKNTTAPSKAQVMLTTAVHFCETPIENRGDQMLQVVGGIDAQDALQTATVLASGLGQLCKNLHDTLNAGDMAYCDGLTAMGFIAETVSALVRSVQKGQVGEARP
jgi:hypothetical protein